MAYDEQDYQRALDNWYNALIIRKDDEPATIQERLKTYHQLTEPLIEFYRQRGKLLEVDGQGEVADITAKVMAGLEAVSK